MKDPAARPHPASDPITDEVPHLRIIKEELWHRVKHLQGTIRADIRRREDRPNAPC
ncbi:hypothetical protein [Cereibacter sphaeroides]|uniref:hypothetical protein n=1 Tax=Cereibacter sphaeroides TaxID=1063 RepID=UPI000191CF92|nr:hypothetical protein [Cereibacter sphaeroides]ACM03903.1 DNA recombinase [Cereibacter sphaeroides KD131]EKX56657.1 hypothetical protein D516_2302 [Rhodobacter sp. AKP1]